MSEIKLGALVRVKFSFLREPAGVVGYAYEAYRGGGVSIITQNGRDLGGFSATEQADYLEFIRQVDGDPYEFKNVTKLDADWREGWFKKIFAEYPPNPRPPKI